MKKPDLRGRVPESWACIDCGINTAPGMLNREQMEQAFARDWNDQGVNQIYNELSEVYTVEPKIWKAAGMEPMGGCLCIGCLEKRLGRTLTARDFPRDSPLNKMPGTERLLARRDGWPLGWWRCCRDCTCVGFRQYGRHRANIRDLASLYSGAEFYLELRVARAGIFLADPQTDAIELFAVVH